MKSAPNVSSDVAFSPAVKAVQTRLGSRKSYERMEQGGGFRTEISPDLREFIDRADSLYLATASAEGQPYIQHRGGPEGFLKVLDDRTLAFADYAGNRQYVSVGNLSENDRAQIFIMDYANQTRIKIWGRARVVQDDAELLQSVIDADYPAKPKWAMVFNIEAWDINCPQHIPRKHGEEDVARIVGPLYERIEQLEAELKRLQKQG